MRILKWTISHRKFCQNRVYPQEVAKKDTLALTFLYVSNFEIKLMPFLLSSHGQVGGRVGDINAPTGLQLTS